MKKRLDDVKGDAFTLFAPSNAAFSKLPSLVVNKITPNKGLLTGKYKFFEYHVVPHTEYSKGLFNREFLRTLDRNHDRIIIHASSAGVHINNNGYVRKADTGTTNGVVHEIDHVLVPARYYLSLLLGK